MNLIQLLNAKPVGVSALNPGQQSGAVRRVTFLTAEDTLFDQPRAATRKAPPSHYQERLGYEAQQTILQYIADHGESTARQIADALDMNLVTTRRHLRILRQDGEIIIMADEPSRRTFVLAGNAGSES